MTSTNPLSSDLTMTNVTTKYQEFHEAQGNSNSTDPYEMMGYKNPLFAQMRYNSVYDFLATYKKDGLVVADAGAGPATMWDYFIETGRIQKLLDNGLKKIVLIETIPEFVAASLPIIAKLNTLGVEVVQSIVDFKDFDHTVDVILSIGALNYYDMLDFTKIIENFWQKSELGLIFESNIQTPHTSTDHGTWNPSVDLIYQLAYALTLHTGKSSVDVNLFKKWTSVWNLKR